MAWDDWTGRIWRLISHNGGPNGVTTRCTLEFSDARGTKNGHCTDGHTSCAWSSPIAITYDSADDRATAQIQVGGVPRTFQLSRYLSTNRMASPVLVAEQTDASNSGSNEEVGRWTAEEGSGWSDSGSASV